MCDAQACVGYVYVDGVDRARSLGAGLRGLAAVAWVRRVTASTERPVPEGTVSPAHLPL